MIRYFRLFALVRLKFIEAQNIINSVNENSSDGGKMCRTHLVNDYQTAAARSAQISHNRNINGQLTALVYVRSHGVSFLHAATHAVRGVARNLI